MQKLIEYILDLIYRKKCYFCGNSKFSVKMCPNCYEKLEFTDFHVNRIILNSNIYCAGLYTKELQKMIRGLKFHGQKDLAYYQAKFMYDYFCKSNIFPDTHYLLVPVPMHKSRKKKRKYNHVDIICEELSKLTGFDCCYNLVERIKDTKPQYKLSRQERLKNLNGAFKINNIIDNNTPILLIDDICTTGSTFEEIIKSLHEYGFNNITCFATATPV